jgi:hypothetical protein
MTESRSRAPSALANIAGLTGESAFAQTARRISGFADLEPDWDSYGGKTPTLEAIDAAQRLLTTISRDRRALAGAERLVPSWVSPLPSGGVQIDWNGPSAELEVDVDPSGRIGYLLQHGHGDLATYEEADDVAPDQVLELLDIALQSSA